MDQVIKDLKTELSTMEEAFPSFFETFSKLQNVTDKNLNFVRKKQRSLSKEDKKELTGFLDEFFKTADGAKKLMEEISQPLSELSNKLNQLKVEKAEQDKKRLDLILNKTLVDMEEEIKKLNEEVLTKKTEEELKI